MVFPGQQEDGSLQTIGRYSHILAGKEHLLGLGSSDARSPAQDPEPLKALQAGHQGDVEHSIQSPRKRLPVLAWKLMSGLHS